jgi:hypothetical protein
MTLHLQNGGIMSDFASIGVDLDGMFIHPTMKAELTEKRLDDVRLDGADNVLVSTYPRTGIYLIFSNP